MGNRFYFYMLYYLGVRGRSVARLYQILQFSATIVIAMLISFVFSKFNVN